MAPENKLTLEQISRAAEDVRTIERFQNEAINNGFDPALFSATVVPNKKKSLCDLPVVVFIVSLIIVFILIILKKVNYLNGLYNDLMFLVCLLFVGFCLMANHLKFNNVINTVILAIVLLAISFIGFDILTPIQALDNAKEVF